MMDEKDILQLIEAEQARRRAADAGHVRRLVERERPGLGPWCAARRSVWRVAASVAVLLVAGGWYMLLPQRVDDRRVLCNIKGEEQLVVNRACSALGSCSNPAVARLCPDGGGTL